MFSQLSTKYRYHGALESLGKVVSRLSITEKFIFGFFTVLLALGSLGALISLNNMLLVSVPEHGGSLSEGIIGTPRFINPLLAISDADRDLTALVYSGLLRATPEGNLVPDLAESYAVSQDGLTYDFVIRKNAVFQDGVPVTSDDVVFTIQKAEDPGLKSPRRPNWEGVGVQKINDREVKLILKQAYSPFLENATMGILPEHLWKNVDVDQFPFSYSNVEPVGSGPYRVESIIRNGNGTPTYYELSPFKNYLGGEPFVSRIILRFYRNGIELRDAYQRGEIEAMNAVSPEEAVNLKANGDRVERTPLPRIFGVFFNQNQASVLSHKEVRQALDAAVDRQLIVDRVLAGYGVPIDGPFPPGLIGSSASADFATSSAARETAAKKILTNAKWTWNDGKGLWEKKTKKVTETLTFSISTSNTPELKATAEMVQEAWKKIGVPVEIRVFEMGELNQNVIRARKYDALLFGEIVGRDFDLFAFWHSSQRNDPGLNIALYTNSKADQLLEAARTSSDPKLRLQKYQAFEQEVKNDTPAVFLYSPDFLYVLPKDLSAFQMNRITVPSDRFLNVNQWYLETDKVWPVFAGQEKTF